VAEEIENQKTGAESVAGGVDPAAVALALGGASRAEADAFLKKQRLLADIQIHHLQEQFKSLRLTIWEKRTGVLLRAATAVVGIVAAGFVGLMLWDAANSNGLIIEPFAVPADMAAKGLTGQVVASQMLDRLAAMQAATDSARPHNPMRMIGATISGWRFPRRAFPSANCSNSSRDGWAMTLTSPAKSGARGPASR
jgi:hypothetical protein